MKKIMLSLVTLALALVLVSCIKPKSEFTDNGEIYEDREWDMFEEGHLVDEPIKISYWSANSAVDHQGATQGRLVDKFNAMQKEKYPNSAIEVEASFQGGYNTQNQKLQASLMGNNNPEIAMIGISSMSLYLDHAVDQRQIFTYDEIRNVYEGFLQFAMYQNKFIGYPYFAATNAFIINKDRWDKTDVSFPDVKTIVENPEDSDWTWEKLEEVSRKMGVTEGGEKRYGLATNGIAIYESLFTQGVSPYNPVATEALFKNDEGLKMMTYWQDMVKNGNMLNPAEDPNHGTKIQAGFSNGEIGMLFASSSGFQAMSEQAEGNFDLEVLPFPKAKNFYSNQSGGGLVVFNNKSNVRQRAAVEFLRWLQEDEQIVEFASSAGYLPTTYSSTKTEAWLKHTETYPIMGKAIELMKIELPEGLSIPMGKAKSLADSEFASYSKGIFYDGATRSPQVILNETFDRVQYVLKQNS